WSFSESTFQLSSALYTTRSSLRLSIQTIHQQTANSGGCECNWGFFGQCGELASQCTVYTHAKSRCRQSSGDSMQPHDNRYRPEVVVYHSAYGLRPAVIEFANKLRAAGHTVHTPDLYDGEVFSDRNDAIRKIQELGFDKLLERAFAAVERLPHDLVYSGFSNGGACAELLAATRPGAGGAILMHAPLMVRDLGWTAWPSNVPVQVHFADKDPIRNQAVVDALGVKVR